MNPATFRKRIAARIKRARWRLGLTQEDAAQKIGLSARYYSEIERDMRTRNPTVDALFAIARGLKVRVVDLVDVDEGERVDLDALDLQPPPTGRPPRRRAR